MIGIIYKLTIIAKYKMDGHRPFYIGQHWCKSKEDFLNRDYPYYGSGSIWNDFLSKIKQEYPTKWRYFIRREILCCVNNHDSQRTLNKLEEYWIKRERAHYSLGLGGCNVIIGASIEVSPMQYDYVREKLSKRMKDDFSSGKRVPFYKGKHLSEEHRKKIGRKGRVVSERARELLRRNIVDSGKYLGENNPNYGHRWTDEMKKAMSEKMSGKNHPNYGKHFSSETRLKISIGNTGERNGMYGRSGSLNPNYGKHWDSAHKKLLADIQRNLRWYTNGVDNIRLKVGDKIPEGYRRGMTIISKTA